MSTQHERLAKIVPLRRQAFVRAARAEYVRRRLEIYGVATEELELQHRLLGQQTDEQDAACLALCRRYEAVLESPARRFRPSMLDEDSD